MLSKNKWHWHALSQQCWSHQGNDWVSKVCHLSFSREHLHTNCVRRENPVNLNLNWNDFFSSWSFFDVVGGALFCFFFLLFFSRSFLMVIFIALLFLVFNVCCCCFFLWMFSLVVLDVDWGLSLEKKYMQSVSFIKTLKPNKTPEGYKFKSHECQNATGGFWSFAPQLLLSSLEWKCNESS